MFSRREAVLSSEMWALVQEQEHVYGVTHRDRIKSVVSPQRKETGKARNAISPAVNRLDSQVCCAHRPNEFLDGNSKKQR